MDGVSEKTNGYNVLKQPATSSEEVDSWCEEEGEKNKEFLEISLDSTGTEDKDRIAKFGRQGEKSFQNRSHQNFEVREKMKFDSLFPIIGDLGRYQAKVYFLLCLPAICCAMHKVGRK